MNRLGRLVVSVTIAAGVLSVSPFGAELGVQGVSAAAEESKRPTRRVPTISESVYKKLSEAQEALDAKENAIALEALLGLTERISRYNGNEKGNIYNMLGYIYFLEEEYDEAIKYYKLVLEQGEDIQEGLEVTVLYTAAQLSFVSEHYQDALKYMEIWISKAENPGPKPRIFMGQVYYQMKDYTNALIQIQMAIDVALERGMKPEENWYQLLAFLFFEKEDWVGYIDTMQIMVKEFPKRDYWVRLAGIYGQEGMEKKQLNTLQAAHAGGYLETQADFTNLAGLLMQREAPFKAAKVMTDGFAKKAIERDANTLQSLGQAWQLAQEVDKAIPVFEEAAGLSDDGKIFERLAYLYMEDDKYKKCVEAADGALDKGGLRKRQTIYIVRGMCQYNQNELTAARGSFVSCRTESRNDDDANNQRICAQWITFIDREAERQRQLAAK